MTRPEAPSAVDLALGAGVALLAGSEAWAQGSPMVAVAGGLALGATAALRRSVPLLVAPICVALLVSVTFALDGETPLGAAVALALAVGTCAALVPPAWSGPLLGVTLGSVAVAIAVLGTPLDVGFATFLYCGPWLLGAELQRRGTQAAAADARALSAVQVAEARSALAVQEERVRIAREMHDVLAHSLSVITLQTQVVRRRTTHSEDRLALQAVEDAARGATVELRGLFGLLRDGDPAPLAPQPGLHLVPALGDLLRSAAIEPRISVDVDPDQLPAGVELAAYRILQEAVINVVRHSGARTAGIEVSMEAGALHLLVVDDGHGPVAEPEPESGHGTVGMRERASLYAGTFTAGPRPGGGYAVEATLPVAETRVSAQ